MTTKTQRPIDHMKISVMLGAHKHKQSKITGTKAYWTGRALETKQGSAQEHVPVGLMVQGPNGPYPSLAGGSHCLERFDSAQKEYG